jgi:hypothetical protein
VLSKGVDFHGQDPFASSLAAGFPTGTTLLTAATCGANTATAHNPFPSSFQCNPSSIDGLGITNSSQGGGGIFVHGWGHNLQIANNRINNNTGTLSGGINVGQGEFPTEYFGGAAAANAAPGSCQTSTVTNRQLPFCFDLNVNVHHNSITSNSSTGDELFSATPAGAGGVSFCTGADYYKFNNNWLCGNLSTGDGGGLGHMGFIYNGDIEHNTILFNQSTNPTIQANGGGIVVMGAPDVDPTCGINTDLDCVPTPPSGPGDGTGPGLVINANLIMGNAAESGSGGGIRFQAVNGAEVINFPTSPANWNSVSVTNNIIANNVAGWDGAGVSLLDSLNVNIINNTIMSNDTTASSGVLFNTIGAPLASAQGPKCTANCGTSSAPQPAGLVAIQNSAELSTAIAGLPAGTPITCPDGHFSGTTATNGTCRSVSYPLLQNDVFYQNRSFYIGVGALGGGTLNQQNVVALYNAFTNAQVSSEPTTDATTANGNGAIITGGTGACVPGASYWDIGVRGDTGPTNHNSTVTLSPTYSVLTDITGYAATALHNTSANPTVVSQYCNGSRTPPEFKSSGYQVPPGISDATVPNPLFNLTPGATVDEGNNWINISWGPLAETNTITGTTLGNYAPAAGSPVINYIPSSAGAPYTNAPGTDFFGAQRKTNSAVDAGAVEFAGGASVAGAATVTPSPLDFGNWATGTTSNVRTLTVTNSGTVALAGGTFTFSAGTPFSRITTGTFPAGAPNCGAALAVGASCTIKVVFAPTAVGPISRTITVAYTAATVTASPVTVTGAGVAARAAVTISPNPLTITVATPVGNAGTGTGTVTLTNNAAAGGSQVAITNVAVTSGAGSGLVTWFFSNGPLAGPDTCTGAAIAPGLSCTVTVRFTNVTSTTGVDHPGTITFTDNATTNPVGSLVGHANP